MENYQIVSLKAIEQNLTISSTQSTEHKFRKVELEQQNGGILLTESKIYKAAIHGCDKFHKKVFQIKQCGNELNKIQHYPHFNQSDIDQPKKLETKIIPLIEKVRTLSLHRSKSEHKNINRRGRNFSAGRGKVYTSAKFSNNFIDSKQSIEQNSHYKELSSLHKKTYSTDFNGFPQGEQKTVKKTIKKKVRVKTNSIVSLSGQIMEEVKHDKCIPLEDFQMQEEESFWQNAFRLRKGTIPVWYEVSKVWNKAEDDKKIQVNKSKQHTKIVYQGYDFNGQLIPSANSVPKHNKIMDNVPEVDVQFFNQDGVQNLEKYHERQQRNAKTIKKIKIHPPEYSIEESEFCNNFQRLQWCKHIQYIKKEDIQEQKISQKSIKVDEQRQQRKTSLHQSSVNQKQSSSNKNQSEEKKKNDHEKLLEEFEKIKFGPCENEVNQNNNFKFGFSKYVKVKKFQEKQKKSKSYNYHTVNFFSTPQQDSQAETQKNLKIKSLTVKGPEKVRANKRLFKQVFNMSLKFIEPDNRQDIVTIKLLKNEQKQNAQDSEKNTKSKAIRMHQSRNSDTQLLKKGFCIKPTIFKQIKEQQPKFSKKIIDQSQELKAKSRTSSKSKIEDTNKDNSMQQSSKENFLFSQSAKQNVRKSMIGGRQSINNKNLQKLFKKQTKNILVKHSVQDIRRQSFL